MMAVTPSRVPRRAAASLPLMPLSLQHHFDRRIVSRPEVARRLVLAVPTHLQNPVCRNRPQVVGATGVVLIHPDSNRSSLQRCARTPRDLGDPARREPARPQLLDASFALYQRISKTRSVGIVFKKSASPALCPFNQTRTPTLCSPSLGDRGTRASSCRENQRGRSMWTRSYAVAPLKLARSISSVVRMFDLRCAYNGTPTTRVANPSASNPWRSVDMCPPSNV